MFVKIYVLIFYKSILDGDWGLGIGGLGVGVVGEAPPPQTPHPTPQTPKIFFLFLKNYLF